MGHGYFFIFDVTATNQLAMLARTSGDLLGAGRCRVRGLGALHVLIAQVCSMSARRTQL